MSSNCLPFGSDATMLLPRYLTIPRGQYIATFMVWAIVPWKIEASAAIFVQFLSGYGIFMVRRSFIVTGIWLTIFKASVAAIMMCDCGSAPFSMTCVCAHTFQTIGSPRATCLSLTCTTEIGLINTITTTKDGIFKRLLLTLAELPYLSQVRFII